MRQIKERMLFVGAGNMAHAIVHGGIKGGAIDPAALGVLDPNQSKREKFPLGFEDVGDAQAWLSGGDGPGVLVLSVKPQMLVDAASGFEGHEGVCVSILAGTRIETVSGVLGARARVVRVMPNTPAQVNEGMSAIARGPQSTDDDIAMTRTLFERVGDVIEIEESMIDAFTGVAGSGPAYVFYLVEAMTSGAERVGFDPDTARRIAEQTVTGSASLLRASQEDAAALRARVTSKNGTTFAATTTLDERDVMDAVSDAIVAARDRGEALGRET